MVGVAQLAEHWVVAPGVEGSNPFTHPFLGLFCVVRRRSDDRLQVPNVTYALGVE
jgi:hypothetical protein